jgi:hypothetical protein
VLASLDLSVWSTDDAELARAQWLWGRRPVAAAAYLLAWELIVSVGILSLACFPYSWPIGASICLAYLTIAFPTILQSTIRRVRWRRDYEASIDRLIRSHRQPC